MRSPSRQPDTPTPMETTMTKLLLAAVAALSLLASPVLAGPWDGPNHYNGYQGDFQLQGR